MPRRGSYEIIAHRGFSARAPENTLAAMDAAVVAGADAVEWDVQVASCGTPVLFHDAHLGRTTNGVGPIRRRTLGELRLLDAGSWFSADFAGERIPALADAFAHVRGRVARVYCEIKAYRELEDLDRIVDVATASGTVDDTVFISSDWNALDHLTGRAPHAILGYIVDEERRFGEALGRAIQRKGSLLDFDHRLVLADPSLAARALARGVESAAWTVNDPGEALQLVEAGVTRLTTDEVEALVAWRDAVRRAVPESPRPEGRPV